MVDKTVRSALRRRVCGTADRSMSPIVAIVDGSNRSADAARWASSVARTSRCDVHLLRIVPETPDVTAEREAWILGGVQLESSDWIIRNGLDVNPPTVVFGRSPEAVVHYARAVDASLIVVCGIDNCGVEPSDRGGVLGNLSRQLNRPVVAVGHPVSARRLGDLVVGIDGTRESEVALRWSWEFARQVGTGLVGVGTDAQLLQSARSSIAAFGSTTPAEATPPVRFVERLGGDADSLTREAQRIDASMVVAGTSQRRRLGRAHLGTVAKRLLRHSGITVAIVPTGH